MFKKLTTIFILLSFTFQVFNQAFIVADYYANTSFFAANCENKAKPKLHCNGKCQMMKKLKEEEKKDHQNPERKEEGKNEVISSKHFFTQMAFNSKELILEHITKHISNYTSHFHGDIFHPPALV